MKGSLSKGRKKQKQKHAALFLQLQLSPAMAFLAPIQYWICGYCSWQAMRNLEREILWKKNARRKSLSQMKIDFSQPFLQQFTMLSEDSERKIL